MRAVLPTVEIDATVITEELSVIEGILTPSL